MNKEELISYLNNIDFENSDIVYNEIEKLVKENQELKLELSGYRQAILNNEEMLGLKEQNEKLKNQLEEYLIQNIDLRADIMIQKMAFPNELIKDKTFYNLYDMPTYEELLVQQKEFIKYLEDEIKQINPKILDDGELNLRLDDIKYTQYLTYKEILQKYKSIIGENDV